MKRKWNHNFATHDSRAEAIANTVGTIDHPHRHDADGKVYIAYYRNDKVLGFVWDGNIEHPVQVTHEMGEPVIDTFLVPDLGGYQTLTTVPDLFGVFKQACDHYADKKV